jgi:DsbC/DsbD-like thiol-disulfide interchange protein
MASGALLPSGSAQDSQVLTAIGEKASGKRDGAMEARVKVQLRPGYHVNSNAPADAFLIPLRLTWHTQSFQVEKVTYPTPRMERYEFSDKPVSVFTGDFEILTRLKVPKTATPGLGALSGKLRYQACNEKMCLPPKTLDVRLPYNVQ